MSSARRPDVTVLVVSFNTRELVLRCIESVLRSVAAVSVDVVVVDNASADGTVEAVRARFPGVRVVANAQNRGFAVANNQALAVAEGRYALLLNPDAEVLPGAIDAVVAHAESDPVVGVVGCRVLDPDGSQQPTIYRTMRLRDFVFDIFVPIRVARRSRLLGYQRYAGADLDVARDVETVTGCFMLVRREAWTAAGPLDEDFFIYGEEAEWCFRLRRHGWRVRYFPGASIVHHGGASTTQLRAAMNLALTRSILLLVQRTQGRGSAWLANLLMLVRETPRAAAFAFTRALRIGTSRTVAVSLEHSASRFRLHLRGLLRTDWSAEARRPP